MTTSQSSRQRTDAHVTDLALKAARGDKKALTQFISATHDDVWRLLAHLADTDLADDLTQETFLRVLSALPRFAARSSARTWILSLARRVWVDSIRHDMARPRKSAAEIEEATFDTPSQQTTGSATWAEWVDTQELLNRLDAERREALVLTQVLGYSYAEAAKIANVRVGTIRSRVARARADLMAMQAATHSAAQDTTQHTDKPAARGHNASRLRRIS